MREDATMRDLNPAEFLAVSGGSDKPANDDKLFFPPEAKEIQAKLNADRLFFPPEVEAMKAAEARKTCRRVQIDPRNQ